MCIMSRACRTASAGQVVRRPVQSVETTDGQRNQIHDEPTATLLFLRNVDVDFRHRDLTRRDTQPLVVS